MGHPDNDKWYVTYHSHSMSWIVYCPNKEHVHVYETEGEAHDLAWELNNS